MVDRNKSHFAGKGTTPAKVIKKKKKDTTTSKSGSTNQKAGGGGGQKTTKPDTKQIAKDYYKSNHPAGGHGSSGSKTTQKSAPTTVSKAGPVRHGQQKTNTNSHPIAKTARDMMANRHADQPNNNRTESRATTKAMPTSSSELRRNYNEDKKRKKQSQQLANNFAPNDPGAQSYGRSTDVNLRANTTRQRSMADHVSKGRTSRDIKEQNQDVDTFAKAKGYQRVGAVMDTIESAANRAQNSTMAKTTYADRRGEGVKMTTEAQREEGNKNWEKWEQKASDYQKKGQDLEQQLITEAEQREKEGKENKVFGITDGRLHLNTAGLKIASMGTDVALDAMTPGGRVGSLGMMAMRTFGQEKNAALEKGATRNQAELSGLVAASTEVMSEMIFGANKLLKGIYGKGAADDMTELLRKKVVDITTRGGTKTVKNIVEGGTRVGTSIIEEALEELVAEGIEPRAANAIYGNALKQEGLDSIFGELEEVEGINMNTVNRLRDHVLDGSYDNDHIVATIRSLGLDDESSAYVYSQIMDANSKVAEANYGEAAMYGGLMGGLFGGISTGIEAYQASAAEGAARGYFGTDGKNADKLLLDQAINSENEEIADKARALKDNYDKQGVLSSFDVNELMNDVYAQNQKDTQRSNSAMDVGSYETHRQGMKQLYDRDENGNSVLSKTAVGMLNESSGRAMEVINSSQGISMSKDQAESVSQAVATFSVGVMGPEEASMFTYDQTENRAILERTMGIELPVVKNKNGTVNISKTNEATKDFLFSEAAHNYVNAAKVETENWINTRRNNASMTIGRAMGKSGKAAFANMEASLEVDDVKQKTLRDYDATVIAFQTVYDAARNGSMDLDAVKKTGVTKGIDPQIIQDAWAAGTEDRNASQRRAKAEGSAVSQTAAKEGLRANSEAQGGDLIVDVKSDEDMEVATEYYNMFRLIAQAFNINIHLVDEEGMKNATKDGKHSQGRSGINGFMRDGEMFLNVTAMTADQAGADRALGYIFAHEITHHMKAYAPEEYQQLENLVRERWHMAEMTGNLGKLKSLSEAIRIRQMEYENGSANKVLSDEAALEEIIADATYEMFGDPDFCETVSQRYPKVAQAIHDAIVNAIKCIRDVLANAVRFTPRQNEALLSQLGILKDFEELWLNGMDVAAHNRMAVGMVPKLPDADGVSWSQVTDQITLDYLNKVDKKVYTPDLSKSGKELTKWIESLPEDGVIEVFRAAVKVDGNYYPPMASKVKGEGMTNPIVMDQWEQSDERPDKAKYNDGKGYAEFDLLQDDGETTGGVAYNPYTHSSLTPLNDQFKRAYTRHNMVVIKGHVPVSEARRKSVLVKKGVRPTEAELDGRYMAPWSKNSVGYTDGWNSGSVSKLLKKSGNPRIVLLSRYFKPVGEVSVDEVADIIANKMLPQIDINKMPKSDRKKYLSNGTIREDGSFNFPWNAVTVELGKALEARGVELGHPDAGTAATKLNKDEYYSTVKYSQAEDSNGNQLSPGQSSYFADSKVRDDQGRLKVMYHGTNTPFFTVFDPLFSDDGRSLFFTDSPLVANTYTYQQTEGSDVDAYNLITPQSSAKDFNESQEKNGGRIRLTEITDDLIREYENHLNEYDGEDKFLQKRLSKTVDKIKGKTGQYAYMFTYGDDTIPTIGREGVLPDEESAVRAAVHGSAFHGAPNRYAVYLNVKNPLVIDAGGRSWHSIPSSMSAAVESVSVRLADDGYEVDIIHLDGSTSTEHADEHHDIVNIVENAGFDAYDADVFADDAIQRLDERRTLSEAEPSIFEDIPRETFFTYDAEADEIGEQTELKNTREWAEYAESEGHDGVIFKNLKDIGGYSGGFVNDVSTVTIAFNSNQVKSVDNLNPTEDPDIRFSQAVSQLMEERGGENYQPTTTLTDGEIKYSVAGEYVRHAVGKVTGSGKGLAAGGEIYVDVEGEISRKEFTVRELRHKWMDATGIPKKEQKALDKAFDQLAKWLESKVEDYRYLGLDNAINATLDYRVDDQGEPTSVVLSAMVKNGEYPINFDFTSVCKKRVAFQKLLSKIVQQEGDNSLYNKIDLSPDNIKKINDILEEHGFEVACPICFVEARRYENQAYVDKIVNTWNDLVKKKNPDAPYMNAASITPESLRDMQKDIDAAWEYFDTETKKLREAADAEKENNPEAANRKKELKKKLDKEEITDEEYDELQVLEGASWPAKVDKLTDNPVFQKLLTAEDLLTEEGTRGLKSIDKLYGLIKQSRGASAPKETTAFTAYNSEVAMLMQKYDDGLSKAAKKRGENGATALRDLLYEIGGIRMQSFSDFQIQYVFDYMQLLADIAAGKLPAHAYTKELAFAELFGMTGMKINLSVVCDIDPSMGEQYAGLTRDADGNLVYNIGKQSIDYDKAAELQSRPGYTSNLGIIMVVMSDEHMKMALEDDNVRYIIPYHKSGLPLPVQKSTSIDLARDYTNRQNSMRITSIKDANKNSLDFKAEIDALNKKAKGDWVKTLKLLNEKAEKEGWTINTSSSGHGPDTKNSEGKTFDVYEELKETKNPRKVANRYIEHCLSSYKLPLCYEFANHKNYYKMLFDFNVLDNKSNRTKQQTEVKNIYPGANITKGESDMSGFIEILDRYMSEQNALEESLEPEYVDVIGEILNNVDIMAEAADEFKFSQAESQVSDQEYMDAVNSGDMAKAQEMVDRFVEDVEQANLDGVKFSVNENFAKKIEAWDKKTTGFSFELGKTSDVLKMIGVKNQSVRIHASKMLSTINSHKGMDTNVFKQIPGLLEDPIIVMLTKDKNNPNRIVLLGEVYDNKGKPVTVVLELVPTSKRGKSMDVVLVASAQGRKSTQSLINGSTILYVKPQKNKTNDWLTVNRLQLPLRSSQFGLTNKITYDDGKVKVIPAEDPDIYFSQAETDPASLDEIEDWMAENEDELGELPPSDRRVAESRARRNGTLEEIMLRADELRKDTRLTHGKVVDEKTIKTETRKLIMYAMQESDTPKKYKQNLVKRSTQAIKRMYALMAENKFDEAADMAYDVALYIVDNLDIVEDSMWRQYKDLRDYFKQTKLALSDQDKADMADYNEWRKANFGRIKMSTKNGLPVDIAYQELVELWPEMFDAEITHPVEQLYAIEAALDKIKPYTLAYNSEESDNMAKDLAIDLVNIAYAGKAWKSYADRAKERYDARAKALKQRHQEAVADVKLASEMAYKRVEAKARREAAEARRQSKAELKEAVADTKLAERMAAGRESAAKVRKVEEEGKRKEARLTQRIQSEKQKLETFKENTRERDKKRRETAKRRKLWDTFVKDYKWLTSRVRKPTDDKHIPDGFEVALAEMLSHIDLQTNRSKANEERTGQQTRATMAMHNLRSELEELAKADDSGVFEYDGDVFEWMKDLSEAFSYKALDDFNNKELEALTFLMRYIRHQMQMVNKARTDAIAENIEELATDAMRTATKSINNKGEAGEYYGQGAKGMIDALINESMVTPRDFFEIIGGGLNKIFLRGFRKGFDQHVRNIATLRGEFEKIFKDFNNKKKPGSEIESWRDATNAQVFKLHGDQTIRLNPAQIMSMYCMMKRDQAGGHIFGGGVCPTQINPYKHGANVFGKAKSYLQVHFSKLQNNGKQIDLLPDEVEMIISTLSQEQLDMADELQRILNTICPEWGNETSLQLYGYRKFTEDNYFPIRSKDSWLESDYGNRQSVERIKNFSFTKATKEGANNTIVLDDIFSVVADHCNKMSLYNAFAAPISDMTRVLNYKAVDENGRGDSVKSMIETAYGRKAMNYINNFMADIQTQQQTRTEGMLNLLKKSMANYKKATIGANLRVALQQPTAVVRALAVMSPKYFPKNFLKAANVKNVLRNMKEMQEHCPIAQWKGWGHNQVDMAADIDRIMMNQEWSRLDFFTMEIYGTLDNITWSYIWAAVKNEIKAKNPDVEVGSQEYWDLCNERASEIYDKTQVVDSPLHRSEVMRNTDVMSKMMTSFMAEPTRTYNMVRTDLVKAKVAWKDGNKKQATAAITRCTAVFIANAAACGGAAALADAIREMWTGDDDDKHKIKLFGKEFEVEDFGVAWFLYAIGNSIDNANPLGMIPYVKDIWGLKSGYGSSNLPLEGWEKLWSAINHAEKKATEGDDKRTWGKIMDEFIQGLGYVTGVPVKNFEREADWIKKKLGIESHAGEVGTEVEDTTTVKEEDQNIVEKVIDGISGMFGKDGDGKTEDAGDGTASDFSLDYTAADDEDGFLDKLAQKAGVEDGSKLDNFLNKHGINLTWDEKQEVIKQNRIEEVKAAAADKSGDDINAAIWRKVTSKNGVFSDETYADGTTINLNSAIDRGDYMAIEDMRDVYEAAGGDLEYFDEQIMKKSKTKFKKLIGGMETEDFMVRGKIKNYLHEQGWTDQMISNKLISGRNRGSKCDIAKEFQKAYAFDEMDTCTDYGARLIEAGLTEDDFYWLCDGAYRSVDPSEFATGEFEWPLANQAGSITSNFGEQRSYEVHPATDIGVSVGTDVIAADGGKVVYVGYFGGYGNQVVVDHCNGYYSYYSHLSGFNVEKGQPVKKGQTIAFSGNTGRSTGPHLDFKIYENADGLGKGTAVDPMKYVSNKP